MAAAARLPRVTGSHLFPPTLHEGGVAGHHLLFGEASKTVGEAGTESTEAGQTTIKHTAVCIHTIFAEHCNTAAASLPDIPEAANTAEEGELRGTQWTASVLEAPAAFVKPRGTLHHSLPDPLRGGPTYVKQMLTTR